LKEQKEENVFLRLISDGDNWMNAFRQNIGILRTYYGWSVRVLSEKANIPESTINKIIQGISKDCDQSLTVKLAKALGVSVDELIGSRTIS
jgi:ribosome-binding protein aMBF1 (putative translation factor)